MLRAALLCLVLVVSRTACAHESWIEPLRWQIAPGETIQADIRVGQNMKGVAMPYLPDSYPRLEVLGPGGALEPQGRIGDKPALSVTAQGPGLYQVVHVSKPFTLHYDSFDKFRAFVAHKDLGDILAWNASRGLGEDVTELYTRYDKSLVAVGDGKGRDRQLGLRIELTLLRNPYTTAAPGLPVLLSWAGSPRGNAQIEVFERDGTGAVRSFLLRTDADGMTLVPVTAGHDYLLSSVVMLAHLPEAPGGPTWHSYWASLTFEVPRTAADR